MEDAAATTIQAHFRRHRAQTALRRQRVAAATIQAHVRRFLARRRDACTHEKEARAARFCAAMARHHERIQQLELEKRHLRELGCGQMDAWQSRREAAAVTIQACWRGGAQRQQLRDAGCAAAALWPARCASPDVAAGRAPPGGLGRPLGGAVVARASGPLWAAAASGRCSAPAAEGSGLSAVGLAAHEAAAIGPGRRCSAIPAARRAVLERQVQLRVEAFRSAGAGGAPEGGDGGRGGRPAPARAASQQCDQRLLAALQQHQQDAAGHLKAARRRQRLLQEADELHRQLQDLPALERLPPQLLGAAAGGAPPAARQAHALALAEACVDGSRWWAPLKALNAAPHGGGGGDGDEWAQAEAVVGAQWERARRALLAV